MTNGFSRHRQDYPSRSVTILGSTGSIGTNTLDLLRRNRDMFHVDTLVAGRNVALLADQAREFSARSAVIADATSYRALADALSGTAIQVAAGMEAVIDASCGGDGRAADWVMAAITGARGLAPILAALRAGSTVALANKEALVCAGSLMVTEARRGNATLLPVDSEHNAIFQVFEEDNRNQIDRLILTASGGPFRKLDRDAMATATPQQAVAHPNWQMGAKISVDSATMMNKGLELIEASFLFDMPEHQIEILVHPQSIVHSLVGYRDGSVLAQLGWPDMRTPIAYALAWPRRMPAPVARLDLAAIGRLDFTPPDSVRFPALRLARSALLEGGGAPTILSAANECAVDLFLRRQIGFLDIADIVAETLERMGPRKAETIEEIVALDAHARQIAYELRQNTTSSRI